MKIVNVTHGSFYALGAYAGASLTGAWLAKGYPPALSYAVLLGAAILVTLVVAPLIERGILRFMYARDEVVILLITYALFLILEDAIEHAPGEGAMRAAALKGEVDRLRFERKFALARGRLFCLPARKHR